MYPQHPSAVRLKTPASPGRGGFCQRAGSVEGRERAGPSRIRFIREETEVGERERKERGRTERGDKEGREGRKGRGRGETEGNGEELCLPERGGARTSHSIFQKVVRPSIPGGCTPGARREGALETAV